MAHKFLSRSNIATAVTVYVFLVYVSIFCASHPKWLRWSGTRATIPLRVAFRNPKNVLAELEDRIN